MRVNGRRSSIAAAARPERPAPRSASVGAAFTHPTARRAASGANRS